MTTIRSHQARAKAWEREVASFVGGWRDRPSWPDTGDIAGIPNVVIEAKSQGRFEIHEWVKQVRKERAAAHAALGLVAVKTRGKSRAVDGIWVVDPECIPYILTLARDAFRGP